MKKLGDRNYILLSAGVKITGDWVGAYSYAYEDIYVDEADILHSYCEWLEDTGKSMGWGNYEERFKEFLEKEKDDIEICKPCYRKKVVCNC